MFFRFVLPFSKWRCNFPSDEVFHPLKTMQEHDEHDELWELLGKAKRPAVSMRFTQDVMRAIEKKESPFRRWLNSFGRPWVPVAAGAFALLLAGGGIWIGALDHRQGPAPEDVAFEEIANLDTQAAPEEDFEIINDLDSLLASEENRVWIEDSPGY